jgi:hypothetical protein
VASAEVPTGKLVPVEQAKMTDDAHAIQGLSSWLTVAKDGESLVDFECGLTQCRLVQSSSSFCFEISARDPVSGTFSRMRTDPILILASLIDRSEAMNFERTKYDVAANSLRGSIVELDDFLNRIHSEYVTQRRSLLDADKFQMEIEAIEELRNHASRLAEACDDALKRYSKRQPRRLQKG